jgi:hypothetical protein
MGCGIHSVTPLGSRTRSFVVYYCGFLYRKTVVCPIIDVISDETFEYITASDMTWGGFNWKLNFRW